MTKVQICLYWRQSMILRVLQISGLTRNIFIFMSDNIRWSRHIITCFINSQNLGTKVLTHLISPLTAQYSTSFHVHPDTEGQRGTEGLPQSTGFWSGEANEDGKCDYFKNDFGSLQIFSAFDCDDYRGKFDYIFFLKI